VLSNGGEIMATQSFYEMMEIDTEEKVERLIEAFRKAEERGPYKSSTNVLKDLEDGKKLIGSMRF
jgi:hypothetical protein